MFAVMFIIVFTVMTIIVAIIMSIVVTTIVMTFITSYIFIGPIKEKPRLYYILNLIAKILKLKIHEVTPFRSSLNIIT